MREPCVQSVLQVTVNGNIIYTYIIEIVMYNVILVSGMPHRTTDLFQIGKGLYIVTLLI